MAHGEKEEQPWPKLKKIKIKKRRNRVVRLSLSSDLKSQFDKMTMQYQYIIIKFYSNIMITKNGMALNSN